jgi:hypothetical protein
MADLFRSVNCDVFNFAADGVHGPGNCLNRVEHYDKRMTFRQLPFADNLMASSANCRKARLA